MFLIVTILNCRIFIWFNFKPWLCYLSSMSNCFRNWFIQWVFSRKSSCIFNFKIYCFLKWLLRYALVLEWFTHCAYIPLIFVVHIIHHFDLPQYLFHFSFFILLFLKLGFHFLLYVFLHIWKKYICFNHLRLLLFFNNDFLLRFLNIDFLRFNNRNIFWFRFWLFLKC